MLSFNKRMFHIPPAKREALHSLEPKACRPMSLGSYRPANLMIRTDSKQRLRLFDMDPDRPFYFFEPGGDTEVGSG